MALKNQTKLLFAEKLEEMLESMTLEQVRIVELCKRAGTISQTFYYHFRDKYELVAWTFLYDFSLVFGDQRPDYSKNKIIESLKQIEKKTHFLLKKLTQINHKTQLTVICKISTYKQLSLRLNTVVVAKN
ncbi:TetR family transcriptional regulator [Pediococcus acidilactici]|uniref:TetR family transcriptional regulator n=1 Tax=Pediococcus acidilactici TaxID=1254 RepID=UPI000A85A8F9|nr:TetR family transcriptional regulator [Pediococcus acidilactici]